MEGYTELFFSDSRKGSKKRIKKGSMSLTYNPIAKTYSITFCQETSSEIRARGFTHARFFRNDIDGNISIILNKDKGLILLNTKDDSTNSNVSIRNKELVVTLGKKLGLTFSEEKANYAKFFISDNISHNASVMSFLIKNDPPILRQREATRRKYSKATITPPDYNAESCMKDSVEV